MQIPDLPPMDRSFHNRTAPFLPPGYRFHPTDEELVVCYLSAKATNTRCCTSAISDVDLNKCEPWDLPEKAKMGENEWYFFSLRDRKYPTSLRTNRATDAGYWKATGKDREVTNSLTGRLVGMKKTLVFYKGRAPKGEKTNWVMHEYRLEGESRLVELYTSSKDEWVVCRIFRKHIGAGKILSEPSYTGLDTKASLPPLLESPYTACTEAAGDNNTSGSHRDPVSHDLPSANQHIDFSLRDSQGREITPTRSSQETVSSIRILAQMTPSAFSLGCGQGNGLIHMHVNRELELQHPSLGSGPALPFSSYIPLQASTSPASSHVVKAFIQQYSNSGKQYEGYGYVGQENSSLITNQIQGTWIGEGNPERKRPNDATQVEPPINRLTGNPSVVCGGGTQSQKSNTFIRYPSEEVTTSNGVEALWTYQCVPLR